MKNIKLIISMLVLLSITACSDSREKVEEIKLKPYSIKLEKGEDMNNSIWGDKPSYKLKIKGTHTKLLVYINGVEIYKHFALSSCYIEYPINNYIATGGNKITLKVFASTNQKLQMEKQAKVTVSLVVHSSETGKEYTVSTIDYDNSAKDKLALSSEPKEYKIFDISPLDPEFVNVSKIKDIHLNNFQGDLIEGRELTQVVSIRTPFPRWKFLDSKEIIDKSFHQLIKSGEAIKFKNSKEIQELYAIYGKIHSAIKENRVASIIDMFDERNAEYDKAWYKNNFYHKKGLPQQFIDPENGKLKPYNPDKLYYFIEDNRKLIYINAIKFVDKDGFVTTFGMKFRRENGKWILTR